MKTKKWIPVALVILIATGAVIAMFLLPDGTHGTVPPRAADAGLIAPEVTLKSHEAPTGASPGPDVLGEMDDTDEFEVIPPLPTLDEEEQEYPTPFARPDTRPQESNGPSSGD